MSSSAPSDAGAGSASDGPRVHALVTQYQDYLRGLARKIAKQLPKQVEFEELVAWGQIGLLEAAHNYRADLGHAFTTFSYYRIRGAIFDGIRRMTWLPPAARRRVARMCGEDSVAENTVTQFAPDASSEVVAKEFADAARGIGAVFLLSQASAGDDESGGPEAVDEKSAADVAEERELVEKLREALGTMASSQRALLEKLYFEHRSMTEIADELGVNKSSVSRTHHKAILELRRALGADDSG